MEREKKIIKTSALGIIVNIILVAFKAVIGLITNSIAIVLDAVNNLTDVISSVVTIIGTKIANKAPDKEHPFGHGRDWLHPDFGSSGQPAAEECALGPEGQLPGCAYGLPAAGRAHGLDR